LVAIRRRFSEEHEVGKTLLGGFSEDSWLDRMTIMGHAGLVMGHAYGENKLAQRATQNVRKKGNGWAGLEIWPMADSWKINTFLFSNPR
jgi:hypothetical protein